MQNIKDLESELQKLNTRQNYIQNVINAYKLIAEYESGELNDDLVGELEGYMISQNINPNMISKVISSINHVDGTKVNSVNGLINRLNDPQVKDTILQYAWEIRIRRGELTRTQLDTVKKSVTRMAMSGTLFGEKLSWFQEQINSANF